MQLGQFTVLLSLHTLYSMILTGSNCLVLLRGSILERFRRMNITYYQYTFEHLYGLDLLVFCLWEVWAACDRWLF